MSNLRELDLSGNQISSLSEVMWVSYCLHELNLSGNTNLQSLPQSTLSSAILRQNSVRTEQLRRHPHHGTLTPDEGGTTTSAPETSTKKIIPESVLQAQMMKARRCSHFDAHYVEATDAKKEQKKTFKPVLESSRGTLLEVLRVSNCGLTHLPPRLCCLAPNLKTLVCSKNQLQSVSLPDQIPSDLKLLDLRENHLGHGNRSQSLSATNGTRIQCGRPFETSSEEKALSCRHSSHKTLDNLETLNLSSNPDLVEVDFDFLDVTDVDLEFALSRQATVSSKLPNLATLDLSGCNIVDINNSISILKLASLQNLHLNNNPDLRSLPTSLLKLS